MMIQSIELKNFKSIKSKSFQLRNLNVVMGLNGMGKSSFIQSFLLLRQSKNLINGELRLNDDLVKIGKGKDAFYQYSKDDELTFIVKFDSDKEQSFFFKYEPETDFFQATNIIDPNASFFHLPIFTQKFQYLNAERLGPRVIYEKSYSDVVVEKSLGINGEYTIHFLEEYGSDEIEFENLIHPNSEKFILEGNERIDKTLIHQVNNWLGEISPEIKLNTPEIKNSDNILLDFQFKQPNRGYTNSFRATNVGFGITYALPVITAILSAKAGQIIIIENPESHIHPKGQAQLGRLMALAAMNDVQIIVETHSDHILNGMRVAVKETCADLSKIIIFLFERRIEETEQYSHVMEISIDRNGELSQYPSNFMNEWSDQLLKLL
jgi:predicted ATPase